MSNCLTNRIEQDHRSVKQCYYPMLGFGAFESAKRFCQTVDEVRNYFQPRTRMGEFVSPSTRRERSVTLVQELQAIFQPPNHKERGGTTGPAGAISKFD